MPQSRSVIAGVTLIAATLPLAACGGGGGGGVQSTPTPPRVAPAAPPPPAPAPPSVTRPMDYNRTEYSVSNGPASINAATAYDRGIDGSGVLVAVVDSGIDREQVEFAGRISPLSRDFAGNPTFDDEDGHGTEVSGVLAAAANSRNALGVAFGATLLALRTDSPGSCAQTGEDEGCEHPDSAIGRAVDFARTSGAGVVNISLGGSPAGSGLRSAIGRATAAGIIVVISAGNDGEEAEGADPDPLAQVALDPSVARGLVIIAGALNEDLTTLAPFSNRAGIGRDAYIAALGRRVRTVNANDQAVLASGTSFAAPIVSGAVALIRQAFPNLTGQQVVDLIYRTARDLGAGGVDATFGHGALDLTRAFQPVGATRLAGTDVVLGALDAGQLGSAMGDGGRIGGLSAVTLDDYGRAFDRSVVGGLRADGPAPVLAGVLADGARTAALSTGRDGLLAVSVRGTTGARPLALTQADAIAARATALAFVQRLDGRTRVGLGLARGADGLAERLDAAREGAFLLAGRADRQSGLHRDADAAVAFSHDWNGVRVTVAAESGRTRTAAVRLLPAARAGWDRSGYATLAVGAERRVGPAILSAGATRMAEDRTVLGARLGPALGTGRGADSWFLDAGGDLALGSGWSVGGAWRRGWTDARAGGALTGGTLTSAAWSLDLGKEGLAGADRLSLRLAQPLRVTGGGLNLSLPTRYDYATLTPGYTDATLDLSPLGRERVAEVAYARALWGGSLSMNGWWRADPGNNAFVGDETGALLRWSAGF